MAPLQQRQRLTLRYPTFFQDPKIPAGATFTHHPRCDSLVVVVSQSQFEAGLARLRDLEDRGSQSEYVSNMNLTLVQSGQRKILSKRAQTPNRRMLGKFVAPQRVVRGRIGIDRFVQSAVDSEICLCIAFQSEPPCLNFLINALLYESARNAPRAERGNATRKYRKQM